MDKVSVALAAAEVHKTDVEINSPAMMGLKGMIPIVIGNYFTEVQLQLL